MILEKRDKTLNNNNLNIIKYKEHLHSVVMEILKLEDELKDDISKLLNSNIEKEVLR